MNRLRQNIGLVGILVALVGIALDRRLVVWIAIGILGVSVVLRIVVSRRQRSTTGATTAADGGEGPGPG